MKRSFLLLAAVILASYTPRVAQAQSRFYDMADEIESQRKEAKSKMNHSGAAGATTNAPRSSAADLYGRVDMAGHPAPGYPTLRSNTAGQTPAYMARGAYNPTARRTARPSAARRTAPPSTTAKAPGAGVPSRSGSYPRRSSTAKDSGPPPLPF